MRADINRACGHCRFASATPNGCFCIPGFGGKVLLGTQTNSSTFSLLCFWPSLLSQWSPPLREILLGLADSIGDYPVLLRGESPKSVGAIIEQTGLGMVCKDRFVEIALSRNVLMDISPQSLASAMSLSARAIIPLRCAQEQQIVVIYHTSDLMAEQNYVAVIADDKWSSACTVRQILCPLIPKMVDLSLLPQSALLVMRHVCEGVPWESLISHLSPQTRMGRLGDLYFWKTDEGTYAFLHAGFTRFAGEEYLPSLLMHIESVLSRIAAGAITPASLLLEPERQTVIEWPQKTE